jgi:Cu(I)/Ag(I) efflux system membrane protein CusA/SilA
MLSVAAAAATVWPASKLGTEFMPTLNEGTLFYMPTSLPGMSVTKAAELAQVQNRIIRSFPEVESVIAKAGRAATATDPAPLEMFETVINLKPESQWRPGLTIDALIAEMDRALQFPGVANSWTMPIRARIDMLSTGIRTPVGIKVFGPNLNTIQDLGIQIEGLLKEVPGTRSVYAERVAGGFFVDIDIQRDAIARYGLTVGEVQEVIQSAVGGMNITRTIEGRERYPVNVRYPRELRDDVEKLKRILVPVRMGGAPKMESGGAASQGMAQIPLTQLADIRVTTGPAMIRDEDAMLAGYVFIDVTGRDIGGYVEEAKRLIQETLKLPVGYFLSWSGQYEFQQRAKERLKILLPVVFFVILILLYMTFHSISESLILMVAVLYAMTGGVILQYILGYNFSVAVWVGYIALYGIAVETGVVMIIYLHEALDRRLNKGPIDSRDIIEATIEGSVLRLRPKIMTVGTTLVGLIPIMWSAGVGADVMKPIATPIIGGVITSTLHVLVITPVIFAIVKERALRKGTLQASEMKH